MSIYGQFCPISKAVEVLGERWTLLLVRELLMGSRRFNELQRGLAKMSPSLLTKRLKELEEAGLLLRTKISGQKGYEYSLSEAGKELTPLVMELAKWGMKWVHSSLSDEELDVELLMWDIQRSIKKDKLPGGRVVIKFHFDDLDKYADWWIVVDERNVDLCTDSPGHEADIYLTGNLRCFTRVWMGDVSWGQVRKDDSIKVMGNSLLAKELPKWLGASQVSVFNPKAASV